LLLVLHKLIGSDADFPLPWLDAESKRGEIVTLGGLKLLMPLTASKDTEVKRLSAHALANLSVDGELARGSDP
jgi:hypothetical protein